MFICPKSPLCISQTQLPPFPNNHSLNSPIISVFSTSGEVFFSLFSPSQVLNRGRKKGEERSRVMNRALGEVDSGKENIKLGQRRRGGHSLVVERCERVRVHWRSLQGQRGQVTLKQHSSVIHGRVGEGCERLA